MPKTCYCRFAFLGSKMFRIFSSRSSNMGSLPTPSYNTDYESMTLAGEIIMIYKLNEIYY